MSAVCLKSSLRIKKDEIVVMSRSVTHNPSPNWGGTRAGAGRRSKDDSLTKRISIRVSPELHALYKSQGSTEAVRRVLEAVLGGGKPANRKPLPEGFDAVNAESFAVPAVEHGRIIRSPSLMAAQCGFPSPALDYSAEEISIYDLVVRHEDATILVRAAGDSMVDAGIFEGDILIVDRALEARSGDIVLAYLHGDFTVKRLRIVDGAPELHPENEAANYPVIRPTEFDDFNVEGVVINSIRRFRR